MGQVQSYDHSNEYDLSKEKENMIKEARARKAIRVVNKKLQEIDSEIFTSLRDNNITQITTICISSAKLSKIPKFMFKENLLTNLESLDFTANFIQLLPKEISNLQKLETLYLSGNKLNQIPQSMSSLNNLTRLDMTSNWLNEIPSCVSGMKSLRHLILKYNSISKIPKGFKFPKTLKTLDLSENHFKELPDDFFEGLSNLQQLNLFANRLSSLPNSISNLESLSTLDATLNFIQELPKGFSNLKKLQILYLIRNKIKKLPEDFGDLESLLILDVSTNGLTSLPESIIKLTKLTTLMATDNKIESLPKGLKQLPLSDLRMNCNAIEEIPAEIFEIYTLSRFQFSYNKIKEIPNGIENLKYLSIFQCEGNQITEIPKEIIKNQQLQMIFIGDNQIKKIPFELSVFPKLCYFSAWNNELENINLKNLSKTMKSINIAHNKNLKIDIEEIKQILSQKIQINANWCFKTTEFYKKDYFRIQESSKYSIGTFDMIGFRPTMEDAMLFKGKLNETTQLWGMFDGHGGDKSSKYVAKNLPKKIAKNLQKTGFSLFMNHPSIFIDKIGTFSDFAVDSTDVLRTSIHEVNEDLRMQKYDDGTTVVLVMISGNKITIANVGDSRAVLCKKGKAIRLTNDHRPTTNEEKIRIQSVKGVVLGNRIKGFSVSRSLGDFSASPYISPEPYLKTFDLDGEEDFIIIGCDGIWDDVSDEDAVEIVKNSMKENNSEDVFVSATRLVNFAFARGSKDNISAIVINLKKNKK
eukprot:gene12111-5603_t